MSYTDRRRANSRTGRRNWIAGTVLRTRNVWGIGSTLFVADDGRLRAVDIPTGAVDTIAGRKTIDAEYATEFILLGGNAAPTRSDTLLNFYSQSGQPLPLIIR